MSVLYWFLCFVIGLIPAYFVFRADKKRILPVKWLPAALRFLTFFLTAALLLAPAFRHQKLVEEKPVVLWLQDESASMKSALKQDSSSFKTKTQNIWNTKNPKFNIVPLGFGISLENHPSFQYRQKGTDIVSSVETALRRYKSQHVTAVVLASDGNYNRGSNPLYVNLGSDIPVYTIGVGDSTKPKDLRVSFVRANKTATLGNVFELVADVQAQKLSGRSGFVKVIQHGKVLQQQPFTIPSNYYNGFFRFYIPASQKGLQQYTVAVSPYPDEQNKQNNQQDVFVNVLEKDFSVLIAASSPHPDIAAIRAALRQNPEFKIQVKYGNAVPASVSGYDLLITHDLPDYRGVKIPAHGNIPMWNIIGSQTNLSEFSKEQNLLKVNPGAGIENVLPVLSPGFSFFALPSNTGMIMAAMPPLKFPAGKYQLSGGQVLLWGNQQTATGRSPLWLINVASPPQAILCGDGIWRWRLYAFKNFQSSETVDELIRQTVVLLTHQGDKNQFQIHLPKYQFQDHEPVRLDATLKDATGNLTNSPAAVFVLKDSSGKTTTYNFDKSGKSYQLYLGSLPAGNYTYEGTTNLSGKTFRDKGAFKVQSIPLEQLKSYSDFALLYQLAHQTGGRFFTLANMNELPKILESNPDMKPLLRQEYHYYHWIDLKWLFFVILLTAAAEWFLRKYWGV